MKLPDGWSRWEKPGDIATHPQLRAGGNNGASNTSTRYLENGDYFKLKTLTLSYSLPKNKLVMASTAKVPYVKADRIFTDDIRAGVDLLKNYRF